MHGNSREPSKQFLCKKRLQHRADMVFTRLDWHEEIPSTVNGTLPLFIKSEDAGKVALRDEIDQRLAVFRRRSRMLRFVCFHFVFRVLRSTAYFSSGYRPLIFGEPTARQ